MKTLTIILFLSLLSVMPSCEKPVLVEEELTENEYAYDLAGISSKKANTFNSLFTRYGNGWTGGDATYSVALPDGRTVWMFGDSFLDTVYADFTRPSSELIRNCFVVQTGWNLNTLVSNTIDDPDALVQTPDPMNEWFWPGDGTVIGETLYVFMHYFIRTGPGAWDFAYVRTDLVSFSLPAITEIARVTVFDDPNIMWGSAILEDGDYIYVYGSESVAFTKYMHVMRYPAGDLFGTQEFWNGDTWTTTEPPSNVGRLEKGNGLSVDVSQQFAVFYHGGKYRLLSQELFLGPTIYTWESTSPKGPWKKKQTVYTTPLINPDCFTYNAFVHPQFTTADGYLLMSYNENGNNFFDLFNDARIYRPKFVWFKYL